MEYMDPDDARVLVGASPDFLFRRGCRDCLVHGSDGGRAARVDRVDQIGLPVDRHWIAGTNFPVVRRDSARRDTVDRRIGC